MRADSLIFNAAIEKPRTRNLSSRQALESVRLRIAVILSTIAHSRDELNAIDFVTKDIPARA